MGRYGYGITPQGAIVSPVLANVFLHHVLDYLVPQEMAPRTSRMAKRIIVRYADDIVVGFQHIAGCRSGTSATFG